jgi:outer membrane beta-barrel protein
LLTVWHTSLQAAAKVPPSSVDQYRVASQYGPRDAILNAAFARDSKVEVSAIGLYSPFSSLIGQSGFGASLVYHISRRHAIEPLYFMAHQTSLSAFSKEQVRDVEKKAGVSNDDVSVAAPKTTFSASYLFSPYYNKMHITERSVAHFDVYTGLGFALVKSSPLNLSGSTGADETKGGASLSLGLRFLFAPRFAFRTELRDVIYSSTNFGASSIGHNLSLNLGLSVFFGSFSD